jgi:uncharacterized membrane protein YkvA (DUF1232 family)
MNRFFTSSLATAATLRNRHMRIAVLLAKIASKISTMNGQEVNAVAMKERANLFVRMVKAYCCGQYRFVPWKGIATLLAALIYFLNPFDVVPDLLPVLGFGDDFAILMGVYHALTREVDQFVAWEKSQPTVS